MSAVPTGQDPVESDRLVAARRLASVGGDAADQGAAVLRDLVEPVGVDRVALAELVLEAASEEEFVELLRRILRASGRTAGRVAAYTNGVVPRTTAYYFVDAKTKRMPTKREQLEQFVIACGLNQMQVRRVLWLWERLRDAAAVAKEQQAAAAAVAVRGPVVQGELVEEASGALVPRAGQDVVHQRGAEAVAAEEFTGVAGSVHTLVVHGGISVEHNHSDHGSHGDAAGDRDSRTGHDGGDQAAGNGPAGGRRRLLAEVLRDPVMFRHLMLLLTLLAVFVLGVASLVIIAVSMPDMLAMTGLTAILFPVGITVVAGLTLTRLAYGLSSSLSDTLKGRPGR